MRFKENSTVVISQDNVINPVLIRFAETYEDTDLESLKTVSVHQKKYLFGINEISSEPSKYIYVRPSKDCNLVLDNAIIQLIANKTTTLWCKFSVVVLDVTDADGTDAIIVVGG